jgi:hypothetical protein
MWPERRGNMPVSPYTKERLEEAARGARTLSEALGTLEVDPKSSTRRYVHERMKKLGGGHRALRA